MQWEDGSADRQTEQDEERNSTKMKVFASIRRKLKEANAQMIEIRQLNR